MTWIRVVPFEDDEKLMAAREAQRALYPIEYATPTHPDHAATDGIVFESAFAQAAYIEQIATPRCPAPVIHNGLTPEELTALLAAKLV